MRVLFVNPDPRKDLTGYSSFSIRPLILPHLAGLVPNGMDIELKEAALETIPWNNTYDIVGIPVLTGYRLQAYEFADRFREKGIPVVLGGPHPTFFPEEGLEHADSVVVGEAEHVLESVLQDASAGCLKEKYESAELHSLAGLPTPRYDLSWVAKAGKKWAIPVQATRGCKFRCDFCCIPMLYKQTYRMRPLEDVIKNIEQAFQQVGRRHIVFTDENLFADYRYAKALLKALIPLKIRWSGQATMMTADDPELLALMKESGATFLQIGMETINQASLKEVKKSHNRVENYPRQLKAFRKHGILTLPNIMFGFDHDEPDIFLRTAKFLTRNRVPYVIPFIFRPIMGTPFYERLRKEGRLHAEGKDIDKWGARMDVVTYKPLRMTEEQLREGLTIFVRYLSGLPSIFRRLFLAPGPSFWNILGINILCNFAFVQKPRLKRILRRILPLRR